MKACKFLSEQEFFWFGNVLFFICFIYSNYQKQWFTIFTSYLSLLFIHFFNHEFFKVSFFFFNPLKHVITYVPGSDEKFLVLPRRDSLEMLVFGYRFWEVGPITFQHPFISNNNYKQYEVFESTNRNYFDWYIFFIYVVDKNKGRS